MAGLSWRTVDGWPIVEPLGKKESDLLKRNLAPGSVFWARLLRILAKQSSRQIIKFSLSKRA
jgi:hypothetical protein